MKPSELKALHLNHSPDSSFFERETMRFFGDTMSNFSVSKVTAWNWYDGCEIECYALYRKRTTSKGAPCGVLRYFSLEGESLHCISRAKGEI